MNSSQLSYPLTWQAAALTDRGKVRKLNEDAFLDRSDIGHWVVADGMGGHSGGDLASRRVVESLAAVTPGEDFATFAAQLEDSLIAVNDELLELAGSTERVIGTTVAGLALHRAFFFIYWCGDSRVYLFRDGRLRQQSIDHTYTQELVDQGKLRPEQMKQHPDNNIITRAVGAGHPLFLDMDLRNLQAGDQFLICSDGLDKELDEAEIEARLAGDGNIEAVTKGLLDSALERGGRDNITLILVRVAAVAAGRQE